MGFCMVSKPTSPSAGCGPRLPYSYRSGVGKIFWVQRIVPLRQVQRDSTNSLPIGVVPPQVPLLLDEKQEVIQHRGLFCGGIPFTELFAQARSPFDTRPRPARAFNDWHVSQWFLPCPRFSNLMLAVVVLIFALFVCYMFLFV